MRVAQVHIAEADGGFGRHVQLTRGIAKICCNRVAVVAGFAAFNHAIAAHRGAVAVGIGVCTSRTAHIPIGCGGDRSVGTARGAGVRVVQGIAGAGVGVIARGWTSPWATCDGLVTDFPHLHNAVAANWSTIVVIVGVGRTWAAAVAVGWLRDFGKGASGLAGAACDECVGRTRVGIGARGRACACATCDTDVASFARFHHAVVAHRGAIGVGGAVGAGGTTTVVVDGRGDWGGDTARLA